MGDFNGDKVVDVGLRNPASGMFLARYGPTFGARAPAKSGHPLGAGGLDQGECGKLKRHRPRSLLRYRRSRIRPRDFADHPAFGAQTEIPWDKG